MQPAFHFNLRQESISLVPGGGRAPGGQQGSVTASLCGDLAHPFVESWDTLSFREATCDSRVPMGVGAVLWASLPGSDEGHGPGACSRLHGGDAGHDRGALRLRAPAAFRESRTPLGRRPIKPSQKVSL